MAGMSDAAWLSPIRANRIASGFADPILQELSGLLCSRQHLKESPLSLAKLSIEGSRVSPILSGVQPFLGSNDPAPRHFGVSLAAVVANAPGSGTAFDAGTSRAVAFSGGAVLMRAKPDTAPASTARETRLMPIACALASNGRWR